MTSKTAIRMTRPATAATTARAAWSGRIPSRRELSWLTAGAGDDRGARVRLYGRQALDHGDQFAELLRAEQRVEPLLIVVLIQFAGRESRIEPRTHLLALGLGDRSIRRASIRRGNRAARCSLGSQYPWPSASLAQRGFAFGRSGVDQRGQPAGTREWSTRSALISNGAGMASRAPSGPITKAQKINDRKATVGVMPTASPAKRGWIRVGPPRSRRRSR